MDTVTNEGNQETPMTLFCVRLEREYVDTHKDSTVRNFLQSLGSLEFMGNPTLAWVRSNLTVDAIEALPEVNVAVESLNQTQRF